ncbi:glycosyltransferase [Nonomuraea sp. NPDC050783]|uniref:glycosyltransferase n=1 Tax=Nonomuraea sp. NPDC050783 TaxID=3154634 RepID=UPI003465DD1A
MARERPFCPPGGLAHVSRRTIDPALGLDLTPSRTLASRTGSVAIVIPAHNEQETIAAVVGECLAALRFLQVEGEVVVAASGCDDDTARYAAKAGATVVTAPLGKGNAITAGLRATTADIVALIDGDLRYYGNTPLAAALVAPILDDLADATVADLYWRPVYPQLWLHGFFAPLAGRLFPEILPKVGNTPWSGQRAALRELWPDRLPEGFTADLAILLHWNDLRARVRPVLADDWTNPQRPKPDLMRREFALLTTHAVRRGRLAVRQVPGLRRWFDEVHDFMSRYRPGEDDPQEFEQDLLRHALSRLDDPAR